MLCITKIMSTPIEVSVIIPVRNSEKYLSACLFSALSQDFDLPYEVIVINNGSSDGSRDIIGEFARKHANLRHIETEGLSVGYARQRGVFEAVGKYICFLDSDDMYKLSFIKRMHEAITKANADIVNCSYMQIKPSGRICPNLLARKKVYDNIGGVEALLKDFNIRGYMPMKMYRAALIKGIKLPISSKLIMFEDFLINFALYAKAEKTIAITNALYFYRRTNESTTATLAHNRTELHLKCFAAVRYLAERSDNPEVIKAFFHRSFRYWLSVFVDVSLSPSANAGPFFAKLHRAEKLKRIIMSPKPMPIVGMPWGDLIEEIK